MNTNKSDNAIASLAKAVGVIVATHEIREWLSANDPMALKQCKEALGQYAEETGLVLVNSRHPNETTSIEWGEGIYLNLKS